MDVKTSGAKVRLKSGGPNMTVQWYDEDTEQVFCKWFDPTMKLQSDNFAPEALELVD